jgi:riboflavin kinase / FMN adenylyltransferase
VRVVFAARLRDERRFAGPDELAAQIADDVARARQLLGDAL